MDQIVSKFFKALTAQESRFLPYVESDNLGLLLRCGINELDWLAFKISKLDDVDERQEEELYLLRLGVTRLMKLSLSAHSSFDAPTLTFRRSPHVSEAVLQLANGLAIVDHGRRLAQSAAAGACRIEERGENDFIITLPPTIPDEDFYERYLVGHFRAEARQRMAELLQSEHGSKVSLEVRRVMDTLVYPFRDHFIGYDADPLLDEYFFGLAYAEVQAMEGFDTFHFATRFGRVTFQAYMLALVFFVSISMRHQEFAEALARKNAGVALEDILTISSETEGLVEALREAVNYFGAAFKSFEEIDLADAREIFEVLSISRTNLDLLDRPGCAVPLLIQCSGQHVIRCLLGAREAPVQFLLDSLRRHFPREYDRNQQTREKAMQVAIERILTSSLGGLEFQRNIKVRSSGRHLTDIDIVVIEPATGMICLCQLKHQDLYGADLHSRHVRTTRLQEQSASWLAAIDAWQAEVGDAGILASLKLPKSFPLSAIRRVVIAKHYAYPLKHVADREDVAYGTWAQFVNSVKLSERGGRSRPVLADLFTILRSAKAPNGPMEHLPEPPSHWQVYALKFGILHDRAPGQSSPHPTPSGGRDRTVG
jgi:hypothetical protein